MARNHPRRPLGQGPGTPPPPAEAPPAAEAPPPPVPQRRRPLAPRAAEEVPGARPAEAAQDASDSGPGDGLSDGGPGDGGPSDGGPGDGGPAGGGSSDGGPAGGPAAAAPAAPGVPAPAVPAPAPAVPAPAAPAPSEGGGEVPAVPGEFPAPRAPGRAPGPPAGAYAHVPAPAAAPAAGGGTAVLDAAPPAAGPAPAEGAAAPAGEAAADAAAGRFQVRLANFEGPFDLLLQLIGKHKLDVTEVALSKVTDEFIAYIRAMGPDWDLDQATEFLVVAATLLDLKAARLLPAAEVEDEEDLALLEARDLLFARLLQYRAYKRVAAILAGRWAEELRHHPRTVGLEPHHAELLPEVVISIGPEGLARLAAKAMLPKPKPKVYVEHIHAPLVSVREQADVVMARLRELGAASFRVLTEDAPDTLTVVARFLALLELYRERAVALEQEEALGELLVRWTGDEESGVVVTDEFDQENLENPEKPEASGKPGDREERDGRGRRRRRGGRDGEDRT